MTIIILTDWNQYKKGQTIKDTWLEDGYYCWYTTAETQGFIPKEYAQDIKKPIQLQLELK